jgi:hypothetical protein
MLSKIKTLETANNIYQFSYKVTEKTTYEQRQEQKEELLYQIKQKAIGGSLVILGFIPFLASHMLISFTLGAIPLLIGIALILTKEHVTG